MEHRNPGNTKFSGEGPRRGDLLAGAQIPGCNSATVCIVNLPMQGLFRFSTDRDYRCQCLANRPHCGIIVAIVSTEQAAIPGNHFA